MDAGASGQAGALRANCGSSNVTNRTEHVVLISAQIGRTLGRSVAFRGCAMTIRVRIATCHISPVPVDSHNSLSLRTNAA